MLVQVLFIGLLSHMLGATKAKIKIEPRVILGETIHWTGLLDWNTGLTNFWFLQRLWFA